MVSRWSPRRIRPPPARLELVELDVEPMPRGDERSPSLSSLAALAPDAPVLWDDAVRTMSALHVSDLGDRAGVDEGARRRRARSPSLLPYQSRRGPADGDTRRPRRSSTAAQRRHRTCGAATRKPHCCAASSPDVSAGRSHAIRVVVSGPVGGGFGLKGSNFPEYGLVMWAARALGRPVRWVASRSESFVSDDHARDNAVRARLALDDDGRFLALDVETVANLGAYLSDYGPHSSTKQSRRTVRNVPDSGDTCACDGRLHQHHADLPLQGGRPPRGHVRDRTPHRPRCGADRIGSGRASPPESHRRRADAVRYGIRVHVRQW